MTEHFSLLLVKSEFIPISLHDKETRILSFSDLNRTSTSHGKNKIIPVLGDTERDNKTVEQTILIIKADIIDV